jgi:hypothetical protein
VQWPRQVLSLAKAGTEVKPRTAAATRDAERIMDLSIGIGVNVTKKTQDP